MNHIDLTVSGNMFPLNQYYLNEVVNCKGVYIYLLVFFQEEIDDNNQRILTYVTYAGGGLSVLCCILSILVFEFFR